MSEYETLKNVPYFDWRSCMGTNDRTTPEIIEALDEYFKPFAQPPFTEKDGKSYFDKIPCIGCGNNQTGDLADMVLGIRGFEWGLAHGSGQCGNCGWPARAYHFIKDKDGKEVMNIKNFILQYHPDFVKKQREQKHG